MRSKFDFGGLYLSEKVKARLDKDNRFLVFCLDSFNRHINADWGDCSTEEKEANNNALETGGKLVSFYILDKKDKLRIYTEADRSLTTLMLIEEIV